MSEATQSRLDAAFEAQRPMLWGLAYRMTGSRADADDVVQDAWVRLRERPPDASRDVAPWLTRVTMNVARDRLRRRKRTYSGPWLPEPVALADATPASDDRLLVRESASFAYLVALEALTPLQRAVLLLREVFELSAKETAVALDATEGGVRAALHRARRALASGAGAATGHAARSDAHRGAMAQLLPALFSGDLAAVEALLAADVAMTTDSGGEFSAATRVVSGRERVARLLLGLARKQSAPASMMELQLNGAPAWLVDQGPRDGRLARHHLTLLDTDASGKVRAVWIVLASSKLARFVEG